MQDVLSVLEKNKAWAAQMTHKDPDFFRRLSNQQAPKYFWIGCSDSRVPSTQLADLLPGEMFVHRNVANVVVHSDLNCLSVLQYAVDILRVKHIIVCGHYRCGGVEAALTTEDHGLIDNWLRHIQDIVHKHSRLMAACHNEAHRSDRLCELNVIEQVVNVCNTTMVQDAWKRQQILYVHGWIYGLHDGVIRDMEITIACPDEIAPQYALALERVS
jgi:carbonic anhydrase